MLECKFWNEKHKMTAYYGTTSAKYHHLQIINGLSKLFILMFTMIKEIQIRGKISQYIFMQDKKLITVIF